MGKRESRRPPVRPRRTWEDNIKVDFREVGLGGGMFLKQVFAEP